MKRVHCLQPEARHAVLDEVATDHPFGQPRLPSLVNHVATVLEIRGHERNELVEAHHDLSAAARGVLRDHVTSRPKCRFARCTLDAPDANAAVAAPLLQDPNGPVTEAVAELCSQLLQSVESMNIAAPAHLTRVDEHVLGAQLHDHVGMRADEDTGSRDFAKDGVERRARVPGIDRIDPDQRPVEPEQLVTQLARLR